MADIKWEDKIWGRTRTLWSGSKLSVHELELNSGSYCSVHKHNERVNEFHVVEGRVRVVALSGLRLVCWDLFPGRSCFIDANVLHQFQVIEDGKMFEAYYPSENPNHRVRDDDIERVTVGGKDYSVEYMLGEPEFVDESHRSLKISWEH